MMILRSGKRLIVDEQKKTQKKTRIPVKKIDAAASASAQGSPYLPEELIQDIVIRLPLEGLSRFSCVSKKWYNFILKDSKFAFSHFLQNRNKLNLIFNLLNVPILRDPKGSKEAYLFSLEEEEEKDKDSSLKYRLLPGTAYFEEYELVGYCNGLACVKLVSEPTHEHGAMHVINPTRNETMALTYVTPTTQGGGGEKCTYLCHGFGFDATSQVYKAVVVFTNSMTAGDQEFVCMVGSLGGANSWRRKIVVGTDQMSPSPGYSPFPSRTVTTTAKADRRSATLSGGGDLFWRVTNSTTYSNGDNSKIDMLLSFDIQTEKIQFIRLPTDCSLVPTTTATRNEHQCSVVDHHLLEFKGHLCVARSEKIVTSRNGDHHHLSYCCSGLRSTLCCCSFKVHLYILKDKVKQVWSKGETFDLQIKEDGLQLPAPICCYLDTTTTSPPTRILSFSDQLLLYWFDGKCLMFYNLQRRHFKVLDCSSSRAIFETKKINGANSGCNVGDDDNLPFPYMDYQLHAQPDNMLSLKTFIAERETRGFYSFSDFQQHIQSSEKTLAGWVNTRRELVKFHAFY